MNAKLLQKIEELHLYIFQQQNEITTQQKQIDDFKYDNEQLQTRRDKLEKLMMNK